MHLDQLLVTPFSIPNYTDSSFDFQIKQKTLSRIPSNGIHPPLHQLKKSQLALTNELQNHKRSKPQSTSIKGPVKP